MIVAGFLSAGDYDYTIVAGKIFARYNIEEQAEQRFETSQSGKQ